MTIEILYNLYANRFYLYYSYNLLSLIAIMNSIKEKFVPQRNITPNFIRFKSRFLVIKEKIVMVNPQPLSKPTGKILSNHNVAILKEVVVASKSTRKEY